MFSVYCRVDERAKVCFEDSLEPSKDEVSPRCCIDEESQMERDQVFGERVTVGPYEIQVVPMAAEPPGKDAGVGTGTGRVKT